MTKEPLPVQENADTLMRLDVNLKKKPEAGTCRYKGMREGLYSGNVGGFKIK